MKRLLILLCLFPLLAQAQIPPPFIRNEFDTNSSFAARQAVTNIARAVVGNSNGNWIASVNGNGSNTTNEFTLTTGSVEFTRPGGASIFRLGTNANNADQFELSGGDLPGFVYNQEGSMEFFEIYVQSLNVTDSGSALGFGIGSGGLQISGGGLFGMTDQTANRVAIWDGGKLLRSSLVSTTELGYVAGVTSPIQTQINALSGSGGNTNAITNASPASLANSVPRLTDRVTATNSNVKIDGADNVTTPGTLQTGLGGTNTGQLDIMNTNGVGAISFTVPGNWGTSNQFVFQTTNWQAGHGFFVASVSGNVVTLTNGPASGSTNLATLAAGSITVGSLTSTGTVTASNGVFTAGGTNTLGPTTFTGAGNMRTNSGAVDATTNLVFVLGTRYTNGPRRMMPAASWQLNASATGTATVSLFVEHNGSVTNKLTVSAGPVSTLVTIGALSGLLVGPGEIYYFNDETGGSGATVDSLPNTNSRQEL